MELTPGRSFTFKLEPEAGDLKSSDGGQKFAGFTNANADINVTCIHEVHGHLNGTDSTAATLLVLRFDLSSQARNRYFKSFRPELPLQPIDRSAAKSKSVWSKLSSLFSGAESGQKTHQASSIPWVEIGMHEPGYGGIQIVSEVRRHKLKTNTIQASIDIQPPVPSPLKANLGWTRSTTTEYDESYRYTVSGGVRGQLRNDTVYFNAEQEKEIKGGIDVLQVAFVIGRENDNDFQLEMRLDANADFTYKTTELLSKVIKRKKNKMVVTVKPSKPDQVLELPEGVVTERLQGLRQNRKAFIALTHVHTAELLYPPQADQGTVFFFTEFNVRLLIPSSDEDTVKAGD